MNKVINLVVGVFMIMAFSIQACAGVAVIVNPKNTITTVSQEDISKIFLGKKKEYLPGQKATPIDLKNGNDLRKKFYESVIGKTPNQVTAYWSRIVFTGKGEPPKDFASEAEVLALVSENVDMIGYVDAESIDDSVKVVFEF